MLEMRSHPPENQRDIVYYPVGLFNCSSFSVFLSHFFYFLFLNTKNDKDEISFSNSIEMAIFKIKTGLLKNTLFQFGEISGYFGPSIL